MDTIKERFVDLANKIRSNQILLPDFQREFKWTEEERQKN